MGVECPQCHKKLKPRADLVGKKVKCPACTHVFVMPAPPTTPPQVAKTRESKGGIVAAMAGHYYQGRVPQRGERVICFACGKEFDGHGPVWVDSSGRERWFCPDGKCMDRIKDVFAGKCVWCQQPLPQSSSAITGSGMGDHFCSESCREACGSATGDAQRRMGLW